MKYVCFLQEIEHELTLKFTKNEYKVIKQAFGN